MKIFLEINNKTDCNFDEKKIELVIGETVRKSGLKNIDSKKIEVSVGVVSPQEMREINEKYRGKDSSTDVLSFSNYAGREGISKDKSKKIFLGEIIVCFEDIREYADRKKISFDEELSRVFSHGTLHLLGFSHGKDMFSIQERVANFFSKS